MEPPKLLRNPHLQTVLPSLLAVRAQFPLELIHFDIDPIQQFMLACRPAAKARQTGVLLIIPGIEGSHQSPVAKLLLASTVFRNHTIYTLSHRGINTPSKQVIPYHAALTDDLKETIHFLNKRHSKEPIHAVGFSMGANLLLTYLSKHPGTIDQATAISTPFDIGHSVEFTPNLYQKQILKNIRHRANRGITTIGQVDWSNINSIRDFDTWVTAPYFGFSSVEDYYEKSSSIHIINKITCPTWLINAADDPFVAPHCWPKADSLPKHIRLIGTENGGHMGFLYFDKGFRSWITEIIAEQNQWFARQHPL
jgi:predicted alpha/beta-fold hydrolase